MPLGAEKPYEDITGETTNRVKGSIADVLVLFRVVAADQRMKPFSQGSAPGRRRCTPKETCTRCRCLCVDVKDFLPSSCAAKTQSRSPTILPRFYRCSPPALRLLWGTCLLQVANGFEQRDRSGQVSPGVEVGCKAGQGHREGSGCSSSSSISRTSSKHVSAPSTSFADDFAKDLRTEIPRNPFENGSPIQGASWSAVSTEVNTGTELPSSTSAFLAFGTPQETVSGGGSSASSTKLAILDNRNHVLEVFFRDRMRKYLSQVKRESDGAASKKGKESGKAGSRKEPVSELAECTKNLVTKQLKYDFGPAESMTAGHAGGSASAGEPNDDSGSAEKQDQKDSDTSSTDVDDYEKESRRKNDEAINGKAVSQVIKDTVEESMAMSVGQEAGLSELLAWNYHGEEAREKAKKENNGQYKPPDNVPLVDNVLRQFRLYRSPSYVEYEDPKSFVEAFRKCTIARTSDHAVCEVASEEIRFPPPSQTRVQQCTEVKSRLQRLHDLALYAKKNDLVSDIALGDKDEESKERMQRLWNAFWGLLVDETLRTDSENTTKHMAGLVDAYCHAGQSPTPVYADGPRPPVFLFGVVEDFRAPWLLGSEFFANGYSHDWYPAYNRRLVLCAMYLAVHEALDVFVLMPDPGKKDYRSRVLFEELMQLMAFLDAGVISLQPLAGENEDRFNVQVLQITSSAEMCDDAVKGHREVEDKDVNAVSSRLRKQLRAFACSPDTTGTDTTGTALVTTIELTKGQAPPVGQMYIPSIRVRDVPAGLSNGASSDTYASVFRHDLEIVRDLLEEQRKRALDTPHSPAEEVDDSSASGTRVASDVAELVMRKLLEEVAASHPDGPQGTSTLQLQERPSKLRRPNSPNTAFVAVEAER
ncbi:unnamed protein product [Amoebophrya sp. A25]|nr:unnamed protein product [Amoebophrya sp. A25]|eukprot:GSA25T00018935001.1